MIYAPQAFHRNEVEILCIRTREPWTKLPSKSLVPLIHRPISQHPTYTLLSKFLHLIIIMLSLVNHRCRYALVTNDCTGGLEIDRHRKIHFTKWNLAILMSQRCHFNSHYHASLRKSKGNNIWSIASRCFTSGCGTSFWYLDEVLDPVVVHFAQRIGAGFILQHYNTRPHSRP